MKEQTYEDGKKAGGKVGYRDGKSAQDTKHIFEPTNFSEEYARGWYDGYDYNLRLGKRMRKVLKDK